MSGSNTKMRSPMKNVRGLGSAHEGTDHFWRQRLTSVASVPLILFFVGFLIVMNGASYEEVRAALSHPAIALIIAVMLVTGLVHMRIGMQIIIEDYVHAEGAKLALLMLNTFFTIAVGVVSIFALAKLSFGG